MIILKWLKIELVSVEMKKQQNIVLEKKEDEKNLTNIINIDKIVQKENGTFLYEVEIICKIKFSNSFIFFLFCNGLPL